MGEPLKEGDPVIQISWSDLITRGCIEYLDAGEEETALIAMTIKDLANARADTTGAYPVQALRPTVSWAQVGNV